MFESVIARLKGSKDTPKRESLGRMVTHSTVLLMVCIGALILILAFLILFHENSNATNGYRLRGLERERSLLLLEQEVLNMQVAQSQALENLNDDPFVQAMRVPRQIRYAQPQEPMHFSSLSASSQPKAITLSSASSSRSGSGSTHSAASGSSVSSH